MVVERDGLLDQGSPIAVLEPQEAVRVRLDAPRSDDLADILFLANNHKIASHLAKMPHPFSLQNAKDLVTRAHGATEDSATFAIRMKSTGRFIGIAKYGRIEFGGPIHVGYWLGEPFWGQGLATEAVHALVDHAFANGNMDELTAACRVTNAASRRVLVKSGFQFRDQSMIHSLGAKGNVPIERFALERTVWLSLKQWGGMS